MYIKEAERTNRWSSTSSRLPGSRRDGISLHSSAATRVILEDYEYPWEAESRFGTNTVRAPTAPAMIDSIFITGK